MAKPGSVRQKEYEQRCKETDREAYLPKCRKQNSEEYKAYKEKDRLWKKKSSNGIQSGTPFSCKESLGKAVARILKRYQKAQPRNTK